MTITEFLLARIAEDEQRATWLRDDLQHQMAAEGTAHSVDERGRFTPTRQLAAELWAFYGGQTRWRNFGRGQHIARFADPARVLTECEAKRRIVELHRRVGLSPIYQCASCGVASQNLGQVFPCGTLRALAAAYSDHPDYDPAWAC